MSTQLVAFETVDGGNVLVLVEDPVAQGGYETVSVGGEIVASAQASLQDAMNVIRPVAETLSRTLAEIPSRPDAVEVSFGLKLGISAGVIVSKGTAEATLNLKLVWDGSRAAKPTE